MENISLEMVTKIVAMAVAVIVLACILVPICNALADGNSGGGDEGGGDSEEPPLDSSPVTVYNDGVHYKAITDDDYNENLVHTIILTKQGNNFLAEVEGNTVTLDITYHQTATESCMIFCGINNLYVMDDGEIIIVSEDWNTGNYVFNNFGALNNLNVEPFEITITAGSYSLADKYDSNYNGDLEIYIDSDGEYVLTTNAKVSCAEPIDRNQDTWSPINPGEVKINTLYPKYPVAVENGQTVYKNLFVTGGGYAIDTIGTTAIEGTVEYHTVDAVAYDEDGTLYGKMMRDGGNTPTLNAVYGEHYFTINSVSLDLDMPSPMIVNRFLAQSSVTYDPSVKCVIDTNEGQYFQNAGGFTSDNTFTVSLNGNNIMYTIDNTTVIDTGLDYSPNVSQDMAESVTLMFGSGSNEVIVYETGNVSAGGDDCGNVHDGQITFTGEVASQNYRVNYSDSENNTTFITISKYMDVNGPWCYCKTAKFTTTPISADFNLHFGQRNTVADYDFGTILGKNVGQRAVYTQVSGNSIESILNGTAYSTISINLESLDLNCDINAYTLNYTEGDYYTLTSVTFDLYFYDTNTNQEEIVQYTADGFLVPTKVMYNAPINSGDDGGSGDNGDTGGVGGTAGGIIKAIPIFVGLGLIIGIYSIFYIDPNSNLNQNENQNQNKKPNSKKE